jgi:hypothetical protein
MKTLKLKHKQSASWIDVLIDDWNWDRVNEWNWFIDNTGRGDRVKRTISPQIPLANFILNISKGIEIDHISRNVYDNQESNLRVCTHQQNNWNKGIRATNTSGYIGVTWDKNCKKWRSSVMHYSKQIYIGLFNDKIEAAKARDIKAIELFGKFAVLNFPQEGYQNIKDNK